MYKIQLSKPWVTDAEKQAVADVLDSGWLTEGEKVAEFEAKLAKYVGVKHAIMVPNATVGIELVMDLVVPRHGIVCVPAFSHYATYLASSRSGHVVSFSDVCASTGNISSYSFSESFSRLPSDVVVPVSWGGNPLDPDLYDTAHDENVLVIEDAACSLGARDRSGRMVGSSAFASVFSFHPRKIITTGEGGAIVTDDDSLDYALRLVKNFGGVNHVYGTNAKMSDINAAVGIEQLRRIDDIIIMRQKKASVYDQMFEDTAFAWNATNIGVRTYQSYCVCVHHRDRLIRDLFERGIETQVGTYYLPIVGDFCFARLLADNLLTLPLHHEITEEDQECVVESIVELLRSYHD